MCVCVCRIAYTRTICETPFFASAIIRPSPLPLAALIFANGQEDKGSITKIQQMLLDASLLTTKHYKVRIKGKWNNPEIGVSLALTSRCSSYWKGSLNITLDYDRPIYLLHLSLSLSLSLYIYIYICIK